ncbi:hypothetical protein GBA52_024901 [Prunus armeniaca]|nr:hypothetical protein GBA52_024901 [Prunus armeniaca]
MYMPTSIKYEAFWKLIGFRVMGTPKLSKLGLEQSQDGRPTGTLPVSSQKQNHEGREGGPKQTISCYDGADPRM